LDSEFPLRSAFSPLITHMLPKNISEKEQVTRSLQLVVFLGYSNSGKTKTIEALCKALARRSYRVGVAKHVHKAGLDLDRRGKDSWRFSKAGASLVVAKSADGEVFMHVKDAASESWNFSRLLKIFEMDEVDYLLVEGFYSEFRGVRHGNTLFVLCARTMKDALDLKSKYQRRQILSVIVPSSISKKLETSPVSNKFSGIPVLKFPADSEKLANLLFERSNAAKRAS
jgi:molybdopterin-guanine dinucleotide biosynthesis protein MobB